MPKMYTTRGYWVDWICVFDKQPSAQEINRKETFLVNYLKSYLSKVAKTMSKGRGFEIWDQVKLEWVPMQPNLINRIAGVKGVRTTITGVSGFPPVEVEEQLKIVDQLKKPTPNWKNILDWDFEIVCTRQMVYHFKAWFEGNDIRYTSETKGTMTPPPPPPPPGS
jgi:hypothetical protein